MQSQLLLQFVQLSIENKTVPTDRNIPVNNVTGSVKRPHHLSHVCGPVSSFQQNYVRQKEKGYAVPTGHSPCKSMFLYLWISGKRG